MKHYAKQPSANWVDTAPIVLGYETEAGQNMVLVDMADLAKTSRICVLFDTFLVAMIAYYNIFNNFPLPYESSDQKDLAAAKAINIARGVLCGIMFFVYPLESFVARHVVMTNLFGGRDAHEGDDHAVLDRWDRRIATTIVLFISALVPVLHFSTVWHDGK
eukprot:scaffold2251_cov73-Cyclotella_meneghiniana.AAC.12